MRRTRPLFTLALLAGTCVTIGACSETSQFQPFAMAQFGHSSMNASDGVGANLPRNRPVANATSRDEAQVNDR